MQKRVLRTGINIKKYNTNLGNKTEQIQYFLYGAIDPLISSFCKNIYFNLALWFFDFWPPSLGSLIQPVLSD
jgi:hypothetical protein